MISVTDAKGPFASETPVPQVAPEQPPIGLESPSEAALLFEVSWEVCAQAGGIYTVLRSKAPATVRRWADASSGRTYREASRSS